VTAANLARGTITIIAGAPMVKKTGPNAAFEVPIFAKGSNRKSLISHFSPSEAPATAAMGNNETTSPACNGNSICGGHKKVSSLSPIRTQARSG